MALRETPWKPELMPWMDWTEADLNLLADELVDFHRQFHPHYGRSEQHRLGLAYLSGLMSTLEAKSAEPMALRFLGTQAVRSLQRFMKNALWDHSAMIKQHQIGLAALLADPEGMLTLDSSEFPKKGNESVGVARQYCGTLGKVENCQSGVFVGYTSRHGHGLLAGRLYLPERWFTPEYAQRREDTWVPENQVFQTKPEIGQELLQNIQATGRFPARWIGVDATFGSDPNFLKSLPPSLSYFAAIRSNTQVFFKKPRTVVPAYSGRGRRPKKLRLAVDQSGPFTVSEIARHPRRRWKKVVLAEGAKGPMVADVACLRVYPSCQGLPQADRLWLFLRRNPDGQIKYAFSNAPATTPCAELCRASTLRWPIEQSFQEGKSQVGMDHYEHRSWPAWHRHMLYVFLALHFLTRIRLRFKKKSKADLASSTLPLSCGVRTPEADACPGLGNCQIPYAS